MYVTDVRQKHRLMPLPIRGGGIITQDEEKSVSRGQNPQIASRVEEGLGTKILDFTTYTTNTDIRAVCVSFLLLLASLPAQRLHSAVFAGVMCLFVCVSVRHMLLLYLNG